MYLNQLIQHSSHVWVSDPVTVEQKIISSLQHTLCKQSQCLQCSTCIQIANKTHSWVVWLEPTSSYTVEQVDEIIASVQFMLDSQEQRFFIFTQADQLTTTCSNRLLKTIEEPHPRYHFIFATQRPEELLDTLKSRCFIQIFEQQSLHNNYESILQPFKNLQCNNPIQFMKTVEKLNIKETATKDIIDLLFEHFHAKLKENQNNIEATSMYLDIIILLKKQLHQLPLSGSSKLFWKNIYLAFAQLIQCFKK